MLKAAMPFPSWDSNTSREKLIEERLKGQIFVTEWMQVIQMVPVELFTFQEMGSLLYVPSSITNLLLNGWWVSPFCPSETAGSDLSIREHYRACCLKQKDPFPTTITC